MDVFWGPFPVTGAGSADSDPNRYYEIIAEVEVDEIYLFSPIIPFGLVAGGRVWRWYTQARGRRAKGCGRPIQGRSGGHRGIRLRCGRPQYERKKRRHNVPVAMNGLACKLAKAAWQVMTERLSWNRRYLDHLQRVGDEPEWGLDQARSLTRSRQPQRLGNGELPRLLCSRRQMGD